MERFMKQRVVAAVCSIASPLHRTDRQRRLLQVSSSKPSSRLTDGRHKRRETGDCGGKNLRRHPCRVTCVEWRLRVILKDKLDQLGNITPPQDRREM
jgi:hypothetical protein